LRRSQRAVLSMATRVGRTKRAESWRGAARKTMFLKRRVAGM
jgi:hypothetical protein